MTSMRELKIRVPEQHLIDFLELLMKLGYVEIEEAGLQMPDWEKDILKKMKNNEETERN